MIALTLICIALIAALVYEKRQNSIREKEWSLERGALLNRIQAPELAALPELEPTAYVAPDDDAGWWDAQREREEQSHVD